MVTEENVLERLRELCRPVKTKVRQNKKTRQCERTMGRHLIRKREVDRGPTDTRRLEVRVKYKREKPAD